MRFIQSILGGYEGSSTSGVQGQGLDTTWSFSPRDQGEQEQQIISRLFHLGGLCRAEASFSGSKPRFLAKTGEDQGW